MPKETKDIKEKETKKSVAKKGVSKTNTTTSKKNSTTKTTSKKVSASKKTTTKKKTTATSKTSKATQKNKYINEYYDLPYRYNQTIVKILAQTPKKLFVYWDISDEDRNNLKISFGDNIFEITRPILIVHNKTLNYSFEVNIDDFANSWYLPIDDAKCEYTIELGRRPITVNHNQTEIINEIPQYIYISSSNNLETPNNKVLYNPPVYKTVYFRNVKTNKIIAKDILDFPFVSNIQNIGEFYNVYDLYKKFYKDEDLDYMNNPSSGNSSSMNFSSQFK